jgi:hypothetical protein
MEEVESLEDLSSPVDLVSTQIFPDSPCDSDVSFSSDELSSSGSMSSRSYGAESDGKCNMF